MPSIKHGSKLDVRVPVEVEGADPATIVASAAFLPGRLVGLPSGVTWGGASMEGTEAVVLVDTTALQRLHYGLWLRLAHGGKVLIFRAADLWID